MMLQVRRRIALGTVCTLMVVSVGWFLWGGLFASIALVLAMAGLVCMQVALHNRGLRMLQGHYMQTEALFSIYSQIQFRAPLPPMRGSAVAPDFIVMLIGFIKERRPKVILELGSGVSTIICGYCVQSNGVGTVVSVDHDEIYAGKTRSNLQRHGVADIVKVQHAPLKPLNISGQTYMWYDMEVLQGVDHVDMLIIDGPPCVSGPMSRYPALPQLFDRLGKEVLVLLDDAGRDGERRAAERWMAELPSLSGEYVNTEHGTYVMHKTREPQ